MSPSLAPLLLLDALARSRSSAQPTQDPALLLLAIAIAAAGFNGGASSASGSHARKASKLKAVTLRDWMAEVYLPAKHHAATDATSVLMRDCLAKFEASLGRPATLFDCRVTVVDGFRSWLAGKCQDGTIRPATANKHLRHLRALINFAAKKRLVKRLPAVEFLEEPAPDVVAWTAEEIQRLKAQARGLTGYVAGVPAAVWWLAWIEVLASIGSRITATMLARRTDYFHGNLLLRRENQKQRKDQRLALPPRAAAAVERLLAAHGSELIFPWDHDGRQWRGKPDGAPCLPSPLSPLRSPLKWKCLMAHFERLIVRPAGLALAKGVKSRQFRRTVATMLDERGGDAQKMLGHASPRTTDRYKDRRRMPVCREALRLAEPAETQLALF